RQVGPLSPQQFSVFSATCTEGRDKVTHLLFASLSVLVICRLFLPLPCWLHQRWGNRFSSLSLRHTPALPESAPEKRRRIDDASPGTAAVPCGFRKAGWERWSVPLLWCGRA